MQEKLTRGQKLYRKHREKRLLTANIYYVRARKAALETLGNKCVKCGFDDFRALQIDHVNGGGKADRKPFTNKLFLENVIQDFLNKGEKYQLLCANCNWIKRYENNEKRK